MSKLLDQLEELKRDHNSAATLEKVLTSLKQEDITDPDSLLRLHEMLLFLRAYPQSASVVTLSEDLLKSFPERLVKAEAAGEDLTALEHPDASGFAGQSVTDNFSFDIVRWLNQRNARQLSIYWEWFEDENRLAQIWPSFIPLLEEDALVEANVPYRDWLRLVRGKKPEVQWLVERFSQLEVPHKDRAKLFDAQKLYVTWTPNYQATRTGMRRPFRRIFYQQTPLLQRRDVNFVDELLRPAPQFTRLSEHDGKKALDMAREASTIRYRELYGFTHGDPKQVLQVGLGRGVELVTFELPSDRRLPLRASHSAMIYKNGVPIGYFEGLSLCEKMESGFNLYYTFRDGETAWLYARILNALGHLAGVTAFSLDPYQIGHENKEGIESGAFWFYYKLGFRPTREELQQLAEKEIERINSRKNYRTSPATLRKLAAGPMILELDQQLKGSWSQFQVRNIGFAVDRLIGKRFGGDAEKFKDTAIASARELLEVREDTFDTISEEVFNQFASVIYLMPSAKRWSTAEKQLLLKLIRAKASGSEGTYLRLTQQHVRFRSELLRLGSHQA